MLFAKSAKVKFCSENYIRLYITKKLVFHNFCTFLLTYWWDWVVLYTLEVSLNSSYEIFFNASVKLIRCYYLIQFLTKVWKTLQTLTQIWEHGFTTLIHSNELAIWSEYYIIGIRNIMNYNSWTTSVEGHKSLGKILYILYVNIVINV